MRDILIFYLNHLNSSQDSLNKYAIQIIILIMMTIFVDFKISPSLSPNYLSAAALKQICESNLSDQMQGDFCFSSLISFNGIQKDEARGIWGNCYHPFQIYFLQLPKKKRSSFRRQKWEKIWEFRESMGWWWLIMAYGSFDSKNDFWEKKRMMMRKNDGRESDVRIWVRERDAVQKMLKRPLFTSMEFIISFLFLFCFVSFYSILSFSMFALRLSLSLSSSSPHLFHPDPSLFLSSHQFISSNSIKSSSDCFPPSTR